MLNVAGRCMLTCVLAHTTPLWLPHYRWVPIKERSRSLSLVYSGMYSGSVLGLALRCALPASAKNSTSLELQLAARRSNHNNAFLQRPAPFDRC